MAAPIILALEALAAMGARAAPRLAGPAMRGSAATERAEKIARAARGTQSMEGANRGFTLVGKPKFGDVVPAGPVTTPPGSAVALRGSTSPAARAPAGVPAAAGPAAGVPAVAGAPSGGALTGQGALLADPRMQRVLNTAGAAGITGAGVLSESPTSLLDYLPQRAEGDPAGAINRRNAPVDYGMSDAQYRFRDLPGYESEGMSGGVAGMPFSDDVRSETPGVPLTGGYTDDGQAAYAAAVRKAVPLARRVTQAAAAPAASGREDYQSTSQRVVERPQGPTAGGAPQRAVLNWGDEGSAADFFRADKAMRELEKNKEEFVGRASGGRTGAGAGGKDAAIHKALEIIHHLLTRR